MRRDVLLLFLFFAGCGTGSSGTDDPRPVGEGNDPLTRTDEELCARWTRDHLRVDGEWSGDESRDSCDPGVLTDAAQENAVRRANLYRWLVGLPPVLHDPAFDAEQQECAVMMAASGTIDHYPPSTWPCYTAAGAKAARSSNLALGTASILPLADTVDGFVRDDGANNYEQVGHRRWVLDPGMRSTSFGYALRRGIAFGCMLIADALPVEERPDVDFVAYPPPGPMPVEAASPDRLTFASSTYLATPQTTVELSMDGGPPASKEITLSLGGIGRVKNTLIVDGPGIPAQGSTMRVSIRGLMREGEPAEVSWTTRWVRCGPR